MLLELKNISKSYNKSHKNEISVLKGISLTFSNKGMVFVLGKSGSGKSTLLNIIGGLEKADEGKIIVANVDTKNFTTDDFDSYRSNYVGFVFQEFNLIESYTVYENIALALEIGGEEINEDEIDILLKKLEINDLGDRRINQLSGGQKQRVAIARALIKKPKIILADEPTGSLDSKTGTEVMNLLKKISKETLVIVVSHDEEHAKKYADRTIQLKDGEIISDSDHTTYIDSSLPYVQNVPKLPVKDAIKLGIHTLRGKKLELIFTILLIAFSTIFLTTTYIIRTYSITENHLNILKSEDIPFVEIKKYYYNNEYKLEKPLQQRDIEDILNQLNNKFNIVYSLNNEGNLIKFLNLNIYEPEDLLNDPPAEKLDIYSNPISKLQIIEVDEDYFSDKESIIGRFPTENNEIMISNYIADIIISYGIYDYNTNEIYYPKNYKQLLASDKIFKFGSLNTIKIVGIIDYNLEEYQPLKGIEVATDKGLINLSTKLRLHSENIYNKVYTKKGFINNLEESNEPSLITSNQYVAKMDNMKGIKGALNIIQNDIEYYDGQKWITTDTLKENEMILNIRNIVDDYNAYEEQLNNYIGNHPGENKLELEKKFIQETVDLNSYIGQSVTLDIYEDTAVLLYTYNREPTNHYENIKIIGVTGLIYSHENDNYFSNKLLFEYIDNYVKIDSVLYDIDDVTDLPKIVKTFPYNEKYSTYTLYSYDIESYYKHMNSFRPVLNILTVVFLLFSILLICNFIYSSITSKKRDIGILKSLGTRNVDIIKIFIVEGIILSLVATILTACALVGTFYFVNNTMMSVTNTIINPFYINLKLCILVFIYIAGVILLSSIPPLIKIAKMKPIDAILNR